MKIFYLKIFILIICLFILLPLYSVKAFSQYYEGNTLDNDLIIISDDEQLTIQINAKTFQNFLSVYLLENNNPKLPINLRAISKVYNLNIITNDQIKTPVKIKLKYDEDVDQYFAKSIFSWEENNKWKKIKSLNNWVDKYLEAEVTNYNLTFAAFEILENSLESNEQIYSTPDNQLVITPPKTWSNFDFTITFKTFDHLTYPENQLRITNIYEYDIKSKQALSLDQPIKIKLNYFNNNNHAKDLYYWDNNKQQWINWPASNFFREQYLTAQLSFKYVRFAIFEQPTAEEGTASWYKYKNCLCAASRDYPKGTILKITNINENYKNYLKSVIVKINDYGPQEWTNNLIDLDKKAFQQLASLKSGIINVRIEKIND